MLRTILTAALAFCGIALAAQTPLERVLGEIERNNPTLKSARLEQEAMFLENKEEALLPDPEIEFNYLWGNDNARRHDFAISQSIDFALLSGQRSNLSSGKNALASLEYKAMRQDVLLEAEKACIELVYYNALEQELSFHLSNARTLVDAYEKALELGESSALEMNNAMLHHTDIKGQLEKARLGKKKAQTLLKSLNGGQEPSLSLTGFDSLGMSPLSPDFDSFFDYASAESPAVNYAKSNIDVSEAELKINRRAWVPGLSIGYMAEVAKPEAYRGLTFGVSIPLWSNSNKVKQSKAKYTAAKIRKDETIQAFYFQLLSLYDEASALKSIAEGYRAALDTSDNRELLKKARQQGEISLIEYISELDLYYENLLDTLEAEKDYNMALAELTAVLL